MSASPAPRRYDFAFTPGYRVAAFVLGITPSTAWVDVTGGEVAVRFGLWRLRTPLANVTSVELSGDYAFVKTAGPPHLSFSDRGITFATNGRRGVCLSFRQPVAGIDPTKRILHPGATLTVRDAERFADDVRRRAGLIA